MHRLRVSVFHLPILFASCARVLCISATCVPYRKIPPNFRKFALTALYGVERRGLVCSPVQVCAPFAPTSGFHISNSYPLCFKFMCTLHYCNMCTIPQNTPKFAQNCVNCTIRRGAKRNSLQSRTGLGTVCTDCGLSYFNSPSSLLHVHVHLALVKHLHHTGTYPRICANLR